MVRLITDTEDDDDDFAKETKKCTAKEREYLPHRGDASKKSEGRGERRGGGASGACPIALVGMIRQIGG